MHRIRPSFLLKTEKHKNPESDFQYILYNVAKPLHICAEIANSLTAWNYLLYNNARNVSL